MADEGVAAGSRTRSRPQLSLALGVHACLLLAGGRAGFGRLGHTSPPRAGTMTTMAAPAAAASATASATTAAAAVNPGAPTAIAATTPPALLPPEILVVLPPL
eukprot:COSAG01_NODE_768_length_13739_cov_6.271334_1_plen_102_part_10